MSVKIKQKRRSGLYLSSERLFSSKSMGSYPVRKAIATNNVVPLGPVTFDESLLTPLKTDIDPAVKSMRIQEKEQIKGLNNRFVSYIKKVQLLEQQNRMLEAKWQLLQNQIATSSGTELMFKAYIINLQKQLDLANNDKNNLGVEKDTWLSQLDNYKSKYEEEINKRADAENHFVELKKDFDAGYICKVELQTKLSALIEEFNFLTAVYDAEMKEVQGCLNETSVVVEMDNSRSLNMDQIVSDIRAQYEEIAARCREEAESWYRIKFDLMTAQANQYGADLHSTKGEIVECKQMISHLQHEIDVIKGQHEPIESSITEVETRGHKMVLNANNHIKELEQALMDAKHLMAKQVKEYQELMNIKLALDIEISTYKKLMEGEEDRFRQKTAVNVYSAPIRNESTEPNKTNHQRRKSGPILIKTTETQNISYN